MEEQEDKLEMSEQYDTLISGLEEKNKIQITLSDSVIQREPQRQSVRYNDQEGSQEEFLNLVYLGSEYYLLNDTKIKDLAGMVVNKKEIALPKNTEIGILDVNKTRGIELLTLDFKTIRNIPVKYGVALYHNKALELYLPVFNRHSKDKERVLEVILNWGIELYKKTLPIVLKKKQPKLKVELEKILKSGREKTKADAFSSKTSFEREVSYQLKNLQTYKMKLAKATKELARFDKPINFEKKINKQIAILKGNKMIRDIKLAHDKIFVFTKRVKIVLDNYEYDLGTYEMIFDLSSNGSKILIFNEQRQGTNANHPHIQAGGNCCFGNIEGKIHKYLDKGQIGECVMVLMAYLHTYNQNSDYIHISPFIESIGTKRKLIKGKPRRKKVKAEPTGTPLATISPEHIADTDPDNALYGHAIIN